MIPFLRPRLNNYDTFYPQYGLSPMQPLKMTPLLNDAGDNLIRKIIC